VNVPIFGEQSTQVRKNTTAILRIDVVKEAVHQDKVEPLVRWDLISRGIGNDKFATMTASSIIDICRIAINANVVRVSKVARICSRTASHIEDPMNLPQIVMGHDGGKFVLGEWSLPQPVGVGKLQDR
jgi:hypothetical protein